MRHPRPLKKDRPDLDALRKAGYKINPWHGEGGTLYRATRPRAPRAGRAS